MTTNCKIYHLIATYSKTIECNNCASNGDKQFNKTVVAPAIGNMTEYLDNINNFSFDPHEPSSVLLALENGMERSMYPQVNEVYARQHWNTAKICEQYKQLYRQLIF